MRATPGRPLPQEEFNSVTLLRMTISVYDRPFYSHLHVSPFCSHTSDSGTTLFIWFSFVLYSFIYCILS